MSPYLSHLLLWFLPLIVLQWVIAGRVLAANWKAVAATTLIAGIYYSITDFFAIREGLWFFGEDQISGFHLGPVPIEEILFFHVTAWLVAQSFIILLPADMRHPAKPRS